MSWLKPLEGNLLNGGRFEIMLGSERETFEIGVLLFLARDARREIAGDHFGVFSWIVFGVSFLKGILLLEGTV